VRIVINGIRRAALPGWIVFGGSVRRPEDRTKKYRRGRSEMTRPRTASHRYGRFGLVKTQYYTAASLDGFIATSDDSLEWLFPLGELEATSYPAFIRNVGALAMGSATYQWMLRHVVGPAAGRPQQPWPYEQPAWVFSSRALPALPDADIRFVRGDVRPVHQAMVAAAGGKNDWIDGGRELAGQFYDHGLLDELFVQVGSVTLGSGKPLLPRAITSPPLRLLSVKAIGTGFAELHYEVSRRP
jgi:dihydrofolate reductase